MNYIFLLLSAFLGCITDICLKRRLSLHRYPHTVIFSLLTCFTFLMAFGDPIRIVKGCLFIQFLIIAGYWDQKTREILNWFPICVAMCGLIDFHPLDSLIGAIWTFAVLIITDRIFDTFGGGDIKLLTACGFTLGTFGAICASILSIFFFSIAHLKKSSRHNRYPLAPFIAIGCFLTFLIT
jgi:leader peptidase (prepilin peptidase)/N-methyltransferase